MADVEASFEQLGELRQVIEDSWEREKSVVSEDECAQLLDDQLPFHFHGPVPPGFGAGPSTRPTSCATSRTPATATSTTARSSAASPGRRS